MDLIGAKDMEVSKKKDKKQENTEYYKTQEASSKPSKAPQNKHQKSLKPKQPPTNTYSESTKPATAEEQKEIAQIMKEENIKTLETVRIVSFG